MSTPLGDLPRSRWERIDAVFLAALDRPVEERHAFLDDACTGDAELRRTVDELLKTADTAPAAAFEAGLRLDRDLVAALARELDHDPVGPGARIGPYRLLRELGRGGSGTVFLAARDDGVYEQQVALKLLRRGLDTDDVLARFRAERQILASLNHPNIASLLDGGATPDGRPFLVLELARGEPVTGYCTRRGLSVAERLRLFLVVTEAVRHAHRKLVVHRDLKPSNILVDGEGTVKLLDFGIAKLLEGSALPGALPDTRTEVRLLTPEYASPEQVLGEPITIATDVYQLGVLLYELLTGRHPHAAGTGGRAELERRILESDPAPPSAVVRAAVEGGTAARSDTASTAARLARTLRGDLDRIVLMALEKEPGRRYGSVERLAEDVEHYLAGRPVRARSGGLAYRAGKLVRRRPAGAAAAFVAVAAAAAFVVTLWAYADRLEAERDRARLEAERAENVSDFLVDLFALPELEEGRGDTLTARVALDRGADRLLDGGPAAGLEPVVYANMLYVLGRAYRGLGLDDDAIPLLQASVQVLGRLEDADPATQAEPLVLLARIHRERYDYSIAERLFDEAISILEAGPAADSPLLAEALENVAVLVRQDPDRSDYATAVARRAVAHRARVQGVDHPAYAGSLAVLSYMTGDPSHRDEAIAAYRLAVESLRRDAGASRSVLAQNLSNLAYMLWRSGDLAAAEPLFREVLDIERDVDGVAHPRPMRTLVNLADVLERLGRRAQAEALLTERLEIERRHRGPDHPRAGLAAQRLGHLHAEAGDHDRALEWYRTAHDVLRTAVGDDDRRTALVVGDIGLVYHRTGLHDRAEHALRAAVRTLRATAGGTDPTTRMLERRLASLCAEWPCSADSRAAAASTP